MRLATDPTTRTGRLAKRRHLLWNNSPYSLCHTCQPSIDPLHACPSTDLTLIAVRWRLANCKLCKRICTTSLHDKYFHAGYENYLTFLKLTNQREIPFPPHSPQTKPGADIQGASATQDTMLVTQTKPNSPCQETPSGACYIDRCPHTGQCPALSHSNRRTEQGG
jgi:hypothetical protein